MYNKEIIQQQRSYKKMNLKWKVLAPDSPGTQMFGDEISSAETAAPKRTRPLNNLYALKKKLIDLWYKIETW